MRFSQAWDYLMWLDPSNYGGVRSKRPQENRQIPTKRANKSKENDTLTQDSMEEEIEESTLQDEFGNDEDDDAPDVEMHWNLAS